MGMREELDQAAELIHKGIVDGAARDSAIQFLRIMMRETMGERVYDSTVETWMGLSDEMCAHLSPEHQEQFKRKLRALILMTV